MGTTPRGYPYPEASDPPDGSAQMQALALAIDGDVQTRIDGLQVQAGQDSVTITTGNQDAETAVTFPEGAFPGTPIVVVQGSNRGIASRSTGASATGFTANVRLTAGTAGENITEFVRWIAVWKPVLG